MASIDGSTGFSQTAVNDGEWHHIAVNRSTAAGFFRLYVDGSLEDHVAITPTSLESNAPVTVGWLEDGGATEYFEGSLDELAFHFVTIPGDQVTLHHTQGLRGIGYCGSVCGDSDGNNSVSITDAVYIINYIFGGGPPPVPLLTADVDCSGGVSITDAVYIINYIFGGGPSPCVGCK